MSRINNILTWTCLCPRGFSIVALIISGIFCIILIINAYCTYNLKHQLETYINFIDAFSYDIEKSIIAMNSIEEFAIANNISQEKHININFVAQIIKCCADLIYVFYYVRCIMINYLCFVSLNNNKLYKSKAANG